MAKEEQRKGWGGGAGRGGGGGVAWHCPLEALDNKGVSAIWNIFIQKISKSNIIKLEFVNK